MLYTWPFDDGDGQPRPTPHVDRPFTGKELPPGLTQILRSALGARLILPEDPGYSAKRSSFNPAFDQYPSGLAYCSSEADVAICLQGVRTFVVPFRIRAAGHSFAGYSSGDDLLVIDVSGLNGIHIDAANRTALVGAGCRLGQLQQALTAQSFHIPIGHPLIAVGGFTQGGGYGDTSRAHGMNGDTVLEARLMLADGRIVVANENVNHDLWWAVRGGTGGNFGVLLSVKYALHPRVPSTDRLLWWRLDQQADRLKAVEALVGFQDRVLPTAPPELFAQADIRYWPDTPEDRSRTPWLRLAFSYLGSAAHLSALISPLLNGGDTPFVGANPRRKDPFERHARFISSLAAKDWQSLVDDFLQNSNLYSTLTADALGGAINSFPLEKSAFVHRNSRFNLYVTGFWTMADRQDESKARSYMQGWDKMVEPWWSGRIFQNFPYATAPDYHQSYWGAALPALLAVKEKYDPTRFFAFPQAIGSGVSGAPRPTWPPLVIHWLGKPITE